MTDFGFFSGQGEDYAGLEEGGSRVLWSLESPRWRIREELEWRVMGS